MEVDKYEQWLYYALIFIGIIMILTGVYYGYKSLNDEMCGSETWLNKKDILSTKTISDTNTITYTAPYNNNEYKHVLKTNICLEVTGNTNNYQKINVNGVNIFANNQTSGFICAQDADITSRKIIIKCEDCNSTNTVTISNSDQEGFLESNTNTFDNIPYTRITFFEHCKQFYKGLMELYLIICGIVFGIYVLLRILDWMGRWINLA